MQIMCVSPVSPANKHLIVYYYMIMTTMAMRQFHLGYKIICTRSALKKQIVIITSKPTTWLSMIRQFWRKIGPTAS